MRRARGGIIATATIEVHAAALIVSTTVAFVESVSFTAIVRTTTTANWLSQLALVLLLATTAAACSMILVVLLWVSEHAGRGLVANGIAEHLDQPLHSIYGGVIVAQALLRGGVRRAKVRNSIGQGGY